MGFFRRKHDEDEEYLEELEIADITEIENFKEEEVKVKPEPMVIDSLESKKQAVENCCDRISTANLRMAELKLEYKAVNSYISDIQIIESLPENGYKKLIDCAKKVVVLEKDRKDFGKSMTKLSSKQYRNMRENEDEIKTIFKQMVEDEKYCQSVKTDMRYLEGERIALKMDLKEQKNLLYVLSGISKIGIVSFIILMVFFAVLTYGYDANLYNAMYYVIGAGVVFTAVVFYLRTRTETNMKLTRLKLNRAIGLLNKVKIKYVNVASRLSYTYEKHGVKSSYQYNKVWSAYLTLKKEQEVYNKASNRLIEAESELVSILESANLKDASIWINQSYALVDPAEMSDIKIHLEKRRTKLKSSLDYNMDVIDKSRDEIKTIVLSNKQHAGELMKILDSYEEALA